jgi:hypothetical protein
MMKWSSSTSRLITSSQLVRKRTSRFLSNTNNERNSNSLLFNTPIILRSINDIVQRYDIFLIDQFGVLHNGLEPSPGNYDKIGISLCELHFLFLHRCIGCVRFLEKSW